MTPTTRRVIVSSTASDSHTWNLVYLQLVVEEFGADVVNLGPCVPAEHLTAACALHRPDLVVLSSVNGHGRVDGLRAVRHLRSVPSLDGVPIVIGGKLGTGALTPRARAELLGAGFDRVYGDGPDGIAAFRDHLGWLVRGAERAAEPVTATA